MEAGAVVIERRSPQLNPIRKFDTNRKNHPLFVIIYAAILRMLDDVVGRKICFVLMPFSDAFDGVYRIVKESVTAGGYECIRADEIFQSRSIMNIVNEMILRAELIIADLTRRNANVFYELGYAHAIGKNTILLTQDDGDVPFDLKHRQYLKYELSDDSLVRLKQRVLNYL